MKKVLLGVAVSALIGGLVTSVNAFPGVDSLLNFAKGLKPSGDMAGMNRGDAVIFHTEHIFPSCIIDGPLCAVALANSLDAPWVSIWIDGTMAAATALDYMASKMHDERTIDASDAIKQLEKALEGGKDGESTGGGSTSSDVPTATVYTPEMVLAQIEVTNVSGEQLFENTREAIKDYLFETPAPDIKGECTQSDKDCATARQNEWLLASVTLASATADKVLDQTAKQNVKDGKTEAEKAEGETGDTETTGGGVTTLTGHFQKLASNFNAETSPTGLYNRMADIVLDTHRQINDANTLMGRGLEAEGLRVVMETGPVLLNGAETETEE